MAAAISLFIFGNVNIFGALPNYTLPNIPESIKIPSITPESQLQLNQSSVPSPVGPLPNDVLSTTSKPIKTSTDAVGETRRPGYTYTPGIGAHRVYTNGRNWNDARLYCEDQGSHLTIINSDAEMEVVKQLLNISKASVSWVGVHDLYKEEQFVTIHGESLARAGFDLWETGEPNNAGGGENCVVINARGKLNDLSCSDRRQFTCELPILLHPIPDIV